MKKKENSHLYAYAALPRTGFCNMLNVWARAYLWARDHNVKMIAPKWCKICRIGVWLRGEKDKRYYINQFQNKGYIKGFRRLFLLAFLRHIRETASESAKNGVVVFSGQGHDLLDVCNRREELRVELFAQASQKIHARLRQLPREYIAVHIRRGDFKVSNLTLPFLYYIKAIRIACEWAPMLPVLIFSDAKKEELSFIDQLGRDLMQRITIMKSAPAFHDLLALSMAKILICTNGSSFSEWAACIGGMRTIWSKEGRLVDDRKMAGKVTRI